MMQLKKFSTALRESARDMLERMEKADIVVGIPAYYSYSSIQHVVETVAAGLDLYFKGKKSLIFVSDGGSTDDTREVARGIHLGYFGIESLTSIYRGVPGKGSALRAVFEAANFLQAEAIAVFDSDLKSITPEWVKNVIEPVYSGYDFVVPFYKRYKYDGTITNTIAYNLTRTLYGYNIRQPIGGDFGCSAKMIASYLQRDVWHTDIAKFGVDIWMTTTAITEGMKICQTELGAKIHGEKDPAEDLSPMFTQVVGTIFNLMEQTEEFWKQTKETVNIPTVGKYRGQEPEAFKVNQDALMEYFHVGFKNFSPIWREMIDEDDFKVISALNDVKNSGDFHLESDTWVRVVYRYAAAFHKTPVQKFKLLSTMLPIYNARVASLVNELESMDADQAEVYFDQQAKVFEQNKQYLIDIW